MPSENHESVYRKCGIKRASKTSNPVLENPFVRFPLNSGSLLVVSKPF